MHLSRARSQRADDAYLWQRRSRDMNEMSFTLAYYYLKSADRLRLFDRLGEDQAFGVKFLMHRSGDARGH